MSDIYKFVKAGAGKDAPLSHELLEDFPSCFEKGPRVINGFKYDRAYVTTLLGDIVVKLINLDDYCPGVDAFYLFTDKSLRDFDGVIRTVADLCTKLEEIMCAYSEARGMNY